MKKYVVFIAFAFIACKKEDGTSINKENLSGKYKVERIQIKVGTNTQDVTNYALPACQQDDIQVLQQDFTYLYNDAGIVCTPSLTHQGIWDLQSGNTIVIEQNPMHIDSFDGSTLQLSDSSTYNGQTYFTSFTWVKQ